MIKYIFRGYISNLMKHNINPHRVYDKNQKKFVNKKDQLKKITCIQNHAVITGAGKYLAMLYQEIYHIDHNNVRKKHSNIINIIMKLVLETGNTCKNLLQYYQFFKKQMKLLSYLQKSKKSLNNTGLLLQITSSKNDFLSSWGNYQKMGLFLGHIFSWYRVFKPKTKLQQQAAQVATLLNILKSTNKDKKEKKEKKEKKGKKEKKKINK